MQQTSPEPVALAEARAWRAVLAVAAVAVLAFTGVTLLTQPTMSSGLPMRVAIASACGLTIWASYRSTAILPWLRWIGIGIGLWTYGYFAYRAASLHMAWAHTVPLLLIGGLMASAFRDVRDMVGVTALVVLESLIAYSQVERPIVPAVAYISSLVTLMLGISVIAVAKVRLEQALRRAHDELEERVAQRTQELANEVDERRRAEADALRASRAKSTFLANMSHELRTPLNAIVGYTELVQDELHDRPALVDDLERVRSSAAHLLRMVSDVLDLSRIEAGHLEIVVEEVALHSVLVELARLVEAERARQGVTWVCEVPDDLMLRTDRTRLAQIVLNLLVNAVKFTPGGTVTVSARARDGLVIVDVADTGIGIRSEELDRVFEKFVQVDDAPTRRRDGSGLGLALSRDLARRLGGTLTVRSTFGEGSTFTLRLPASGPSGR